MSKLKKQPKSVGRAYLVQQLGKRGLARRDAVAIINAMFAVLAAALRRGEAVEFPFGKLVRVRKSFGEWWDRADDWPAHREPYTYEWELSPEGWEELFGPLGKRERACFDRGWEAPRPENRRIRWR